LLGSGGSFPSWNPTGTQIAFSRLASGGRYDLYLINADGTGERRLTETPAFDEIAPRFSPDGTRLVFEYDNLPAYTGGTPIVYHPDNGVYILTLATGATRRVLAQPFPGRPDWSSDGTQIVCGGYDVDFRKGVFLVSPDGVFLRHVAINDLVLNPRMSPDGNRIAYSGQLGGHLFDLKMQSEAGFDIGNNPDWSRDGRLVFGPSSFSGGNTLQVVDANGNNRRSLETSGSFPDAY
jgi:TolB protein